MGSNGYRFHLTLVILFLTFFFVTACSTPSWLALKKAPPHKAKTKDLLDKEVIIIDRREYVKIVNPHTQEGGNQPKYLYIPVEEYLANKEKYTVPTTRSPLAKAATPVSGPTSPSVSDRSDLPVAPIATSTTPPLKKKILITHFEDRTTSEGEGIGDWLAETLIKEMAYRAPQTVFVDFQTIKEFLERNGNDLEEIKSPKTLKLLNELFGIHAIAMGELTGPYVFTTRSPKDRESTSTALIKIEMKVRDTLSGKTLNTISVQNPIFSTKEKGIFSDEKAKRRAFELALNELSRSLLKELDRLDWFCRPAKIEGDEIYINVGRLTGLREGDVMEILRPSILGGKDQVRGQVRISTLFGLDASVGKLIQGGKPEEEDILKFLRRGGS
ncbi:MAG: hypothetical protein N3G78_13215 [Desulfobacterota bacterium]|nr:hypothetical protein [Thermodesulfobacteriota bacterium]